MATCLDGDSFYLDASVTYDGLPTFDGCYLDSGFTLNDLTVYSRGGSYYDYEPAVIATTNYGTAMWVLSFHDVAEDMFYHRCLDVDENDATLIHPTEVTQWNCWDSDSGGNSDSEHYTTLDAVTTNCGCPTPSPTMGPTSPEPTPVPFTPTPTPSTAAATVAPSTPAPEPVAPVSPPTPQPTGLSTCGATESFRISSGSLPEVGGCFQATGDSFSNPGATIEVWSVSGSTNSEQVIVVGFADDGTGETSDSPYSLMYFAEVEDDQIWYCLSNEDAITVHPVEATWQCDISGTGSFANVTDADISFDCGCINTPSPIVPSEPSSSSSPSSSTPASVPLWAVILGAVGGASLLILVGICVGRHRRQNTRNGNSRSPPPGGSSLPVVSQGVGGAGAMVGSESAFVSHMQPPDSPGLPSTKANLAPVTGEEPPPPPPPYSDPPAYSG
ncbi:unnamed protein product [Scytosiphon promiscuus]